MRATVCVCGGGGGGVRGCVRYRKGDETRFRDVDVHKSRLPPAAEIFIDENNQ